MSHIAGRGLHLPRYRVDTGTIRDQWGGGSAGVAAKATQARDDDVVTMGLAAARRALDDETEIDGLYLATTTPVYQYGSVTPMLVEALGLGAGTETLSFTESARAGTAALGAAHRAADADGSTVLVVASEAPGPTPGSSREKTAGAGAAAAVVAPGSGSGLELVGTAARSTPVLDEWQAPGESTRHLADDRFRRQYGYVEPVSSVVRDVLDERGWDAADLDGLVVGQPNAKYPSRIPRALGLAADVLVGGEFARTYGDLGAASALAILAGASGDDGDRLVVAGCGSGCADALGYVARGEYAANDPPADHCSVDLDYVDYLTTTGVLRR